jgi:hypothetical protein
MSLFQEYLDSKKTLKKPVVDASGDQIDPKTMPNKPPKAKNRYKPGVTEPRTPKGKQWGDLGEKKLVYKPDLKSATGCTPAKIPTAEQVSAANQFADLIERDPVVLETLARTLRQRGTFGALVAEVFEHKEAVAHLAQILTHDGYGPKLYRSLTNAINEETDIPYADELESDSPDDEDDDEDNDPFKDEDEDDVDTDDTGDGDGADIDASQEPENADPNAMMDPNMMGMMGMDPNAMMGQMQPGMDPSMMMGQPPMPGMDPNAGMMGQMPPQAPMMPMMMKRFQTAYQRAMMRKK